MLGHTALRISLKVGSLLIAVRESFKATLEGVIGPERIRGIADCGLQIADLFPGVRTFVLSNIPSPFASADCLASFITSVKRPAVARLASFSRGRGTAKHPAVAGLGAACSSGVAQEQVGSPLSFPPPAPREARGLEPVETAALPEGSEDVAGSDFWRADCNWMR